jgi:hypothetical protein
MTCLVIEDLTQWEQVIFHCLAFVCELLTLTNTHQELSCQRDSQKRVVTKQQIVSLIRFSCELIKLFQKIIYLRALPNRNIGQNKRVQTYECRGAFVNTVNNILYNLIFLEILFVECSLDQWLSYERGIVVFQGEEEQLLIKECTVESHKVETNLILTTS